MDQFMEEFGSNQIGQETDNQLMDAFSLMDEDSIHPGHEPSVSLYGQTIAATSTLELNDIVHDIWYSDLENTDRVTGQAQNDDVTTLLTPAESPIFHCENANISIIDNCASSNSNSNGYANNSSLDRFTYQFIFDPNHAIKENEFSGIVNVLKSRILLDHFKHNH